MSAGLTERGRTMTWALAAALAIPAAAAVCWPVWPGHMSFDGLLAYDQAVRGVRTMLWPPLHSYIFALFRMAHLGVGWVLFAQVFLLFFAAAALFGLMLGRAWRMVAAFGAMVALILAVPAVLGSLFAHWRDVPVASFALMGLALWAAGRRTPWLAVLAVLAEGLALGLRYNAVGLIFPLLALMLWKPLPRGAATLRARLAVILAMLVVLPLAWASTRWRLPDLALLPASSGFEATKELDLIGISACANRSYLPPGLTGGAPITGQQLRWTYDPRHLQLALEPRAGVPAIYESDAGGELSPAWSRAVRAQFGCYLSHRTTVFMEQMGMAREGVFYAVHGGIDPNPHGLKLSRPDASKTVTDYVGAHANDLWRRPFWLYPLAAAAVAWAFARRRAEAWPMAALAVGAFGYAGLLFVAAPAADARYIFPSNLACIVLIAWTIGGLGRRSVPA